MCGKAMESLGNRISEKLVNNKKDYLKCTSKLNYMPHNIFDNNIVGIRKSKVSLKLNKSAYTGMCILEWVKYKCTNSIMITLKINITNQNYCLQILRD